MSILRSLEHKRCRLLWLQMDSIAEDEAPEEAGPMTAALANLSRQFSHSSSGKSSLGRRHGSRFSLSRFSNSRQRSRLGPQQRPLIQKQGSHEGGLSHQQLGSEAAAAEPSHAAEGGQPRQGGAKQVTSDVGNRVCVHLLSSP